MTHHVVALDNIILRAENIDHDVLVTYGVILNEEMEKKKHVLAKVLEDFVVFGRCEVPSREVTDNGPHDCSTSLQLDGAEGS